MTAALAPLETPPGASAGGTAAAPPPATRGYVRGSTLLLGGRVISIVVSFAVQVLTVRYLSKTDYGALAYALGAVSMGSSAVLVGLDKSVPRFLPLYQERGDQARVLGAVVVASALIWGLGVSLILCVLGARGLLQSSGVTDAHALGLLLTLIALAPLEAFGALLQNVLAVFAGARAIFIRRHLVGPLFKLGAVLAVMAVSGSVQMLAYGYLVGGTVGIAIYLSMLGRVWHSQGLLGRLRWRRLTFPAGELLRFSVPLFSSDLLIILRTFLAVALLEYFHNSDAVAEYRAVLPVGRLNMFAFEAFAFLFVPVAARMFAKRDNRGIAELYWQTAVVIAVMTFPILALTLPLAEPVTLLLFGPRYQTSAAVLAVLAFGHYLHASFGFNTAVLRVHGRVRFIVATDITAAIFAVASGLLLVPRFGAVGAALSTTGTMALHNTLNQLGLRALGIGGIPPEARLRRVYIAVAAVTSLLIATQVVFEPPVYVDAVLAVLASLVVLRSSRDAVGSLAAFPELLRVPLVGRLVGRRATKGGGSTIDSESWFQRHVVDRAPVYFPTDHSDSPVEVRLLERRRRPASELLWFRIARGAVERTVILKMPHAAPSAGRRVNTTSGERPRWGAVVPSSDKYLLESSALEAIHRHFQQERDPRFGTVRPYDVLPQRRAFVMEAVEELSLRRALESNACRSTDLGRAFNNAGAWLRTFHGMSRDEGVTPRHTTRDEFIAHVHRLLDFLQQYRTAAAVVGDVRRQLPAAAQRALPSQLPLGIGHGDYALRNVLADGTGRVTVIDTLARWRTSIFEDIGYFLVDLKHGGSRCRRWLAGVPPGALAEYEARFLRGYFGDDVPKEAIRIYELHALLDRWAAHLSRRVSPRNAAEVGVAVRESVAAALLGARARQAVSAPW